MENEKLVLKFEENDDLLEYENKVILIEDKKLINDLGKENIRNGNSSLLIKSLNDLPVYDVIQLKINVAETGVFLASFSKDKIDEKVREELLNKIKELKDDVTPTHETQLAKINKLIAILNEYLPIYISFRNYGDIKVTFDELKDLEVSSPLFLLFKPEKPKKIKPVKEPKPRKEIKFNFKKLKIKFKLPKFPKIHIDFPLFTVDYLFCGIFPLLFGFGIVTGIYEVLNDQSISIFLFIIAGLFLGITYYTVYETLYKKGKLNYKGLRYWLLLYIFIGAAIGIVVGFVISKFALKDEVESINYGLMMAIGAPSSAVVSMLSIYASMLINLIVKKIKKY